MTLGIATRLLLTMPNEYTLHSFIRNHLYTTKHYGRFFIEIFLQTDNGFVFIFLKFKKWKNICKLRKLSEADENKFFSILKISYP